MKNSVNIASDILAIIEKIPGVDPSFEIIDPRQLKLSTGSSLSFYLGLSLEATGVLVRTFVFSRPISLLYLMVT